MLKNACNIRIKLFCTVSKIGRAEWDNMQAGFAAWRSNEMAIKN